MDKVNYHPYFMSRRQKGHLRSNNTDVCGLLNVSQKNEFKAKLPRVSHKRYNELIQRKYNSVIEESKRLFKKVYGCNIPRQVSVLNEEMEYDPHTLLETDQVIPVDVIIEETDMTYNPYKRKAPTPAEGNYIIPKKKSFKTRISCSIRDCYYLKLLWLY
ncbi:uncharacterized protein LOC126907785 [Daktulosphaira vitifoliae]|uniref:uncharacterized protein LOC126907785 n=1 Tax=Daktulosphaira vitifoliae TaxID=58002 RepID=UPI0021A97ABC|nr:uncharacterized protein LOC126907785 [Daktulosphaira vitifoliae]